MQDTLHNRIVARALRDGWRKGNWKTALRAKLKEEPWADEALDILDDIGDMRQIPDAWRLRVEGPGDNPDDYPVEVINPDWNSPVLVLEFLEVEIAHPMTLEKREAYTALWWRFDASDMFHFRCYVAERYGEIKLWLDTETAYEESALHWGKPSTD